MDETILNKSFDGIKKVEENASSEENTAVSSDTENVETTVSETSETVENAEENVQNEAPAEAEPIESDESQEA